MDSFRHFFHLLQKVISENTHALITGSTILTLDSSLIDAIKKLSNEALETSERERTEIKSLINVLNNVQKLKISHRSVLMNVDLYIESFRSLKHLELSNLFIDKISGLYILKSQLENFICIRCLNQDNVLNDDNIWSELKVLVLRHGHITSLGINYFKNCPWLRHLDLSYNNIKNVIGLQSLDNLTYIDLSFNCLESIPVFNNPCSKNLKILLISHNYITSLKGVKHLVNLRGLDASNNCILDRFAIKELSMLSFLQWINLSFNPLWHNPHHRLYTVNYIQTRTSPQQFVLDNVALNIIEQSLLSAHKTTKYTRETERIFNNHSHIGEGERQVSGHSKKFYKRKASKVREVVIEENNEGDNVPKTSSDVLTSVEEESRQKLEILREKYGKDWLLGQSGSHVQDLMGLTKPDKSLVSHYDILTASALLCQESKTNEYNSQSGKSPSTVGIKKCDISENKSETGITVVTVHAIKNSEHLESDNKCVNTNVEQENLETASSEHNGEELSDAASEEMFVSATEEQIDDANESDENNQDDMTGSEPLWFVQKFNAISNKSENIFLSLLDNELRERDTSNGRTMAKWALNTVQSCVKIKADPMTIEIEFDTVRKDKQSRIYIMEFADAQILLKRLSGILEARPLSAMNQTAYKCMKCTSLFTHFKSSQRTQNSKSNGVVCQICSSSFVIEMEEPRLPANKVSHEKSISHSPSQSSIGSAASLDQSLKSVKQSVGVIAPRKCESDIEIISNPSQSSIEVLDDHLRLQGANTPGRKRSSEERQAVVAVPQLGTVPEVQNPCGLTESSSSGSMNESIITTYETHPTINKKIVHEGSVLEETKEESPTQTECDTLLTLKSETEKQITDDTLKHDEDNTTEKSEDKDCDAVMYSYTDFTAVDERIRIYLRNAVFENEKEVLKCLVKCHLWKSGGVDVQACIVLSTESLYILPFISSNYGLDASKWLSKTESYKLKEIKTIFPIVWYQGAGIQIKNIFYLILLQDRERTESLFKCLQGSSLKICKIQKTPNSKVESQLQQLAKNSNIYHSAEDPTISLFTICSSISIFKNEDCQDTMRLVGLLITEGELHIILGDLSWLTGPSGVKPSIHCSQMISCLTQIERSNSTLKLCFLDEAKNTEEVWCLCLATDSEVSAVIRVIQIPWEKLFSIPLDMTTINENK